MGLDKIVDLSVFLLFYTYFFSKSELQQLICMDIHGKVVPKVAKAQNTRAHKWTQKAQTQLIPTPKLNMPIKYLKYNKKQMTPNNSIKLVSSTVTATKDHVHKYLVSFILLFTWLNVWINFPRRVWSSILLVYWSTLRCCMMLSNLHQIQHHLNFGSPSRMVSILHSRRPCPL